MARAKQITLTLTDWQRERLAELPDNKRSAYIREALTEKLTRDEQRGQTKMSNTDVIIATPALHVGLLEVGDVVALTLHVNTSTGGSWFELELEEHSRCTGYNNLTAGPRGLGRIIGRVGPSYSQTYRVVEDATLTEADLAVTVARLEAVQQERQRGREAIKTLQALENDPRRTNRPLGHALCEGSPSRPFPPEVYAEDRRNQAELLAEWNAAAEIVQKTLGLTIADLRADGTLMDR